MEELKNIKISLPSLGFCQAELQALLSQQRQFDWRAFEEHLKRKVAPVYALVPIKVVVEMKETFKRLIVQVANEHGINERDFPKMAGQVLGLLLGLSK